MLRAMTRRENGNEKSHNLASGFQFAFFVGVTTLPHCYFTITVLSGWISRLVESPDRENHEKMYHESTTTLWRYRIGILLWPRTIEANFASMAKTFI